MKIRTGFVSNSSSASFTVLKKDITAQQAEDLLEYTFSEENVDGWNITESKGIIRGSTTMDNDHLDEFLDSINFPQEKMNFESY